MATRRRFIGLCSALAVSTVLLPASVAGAPRRWRAVSVADIPFETLARLVSSMFVVRDPRGGVQTVELIEARLAVGEDRSASVGPDESFSLLFRGDASRPLEQDTYAFEHARLGRFEVFIVPVGRGDHAVRHYEAVFHRLSAATLTNPFPSHG